MHEENLGRRKLATRTMVWAQKTAKILHQIGFTPNQISILSIVFSFISAWCFYKASVSAQTYFFFLAALFIQLRLLCNLFDGMVAIEHNQKSVYGNLFNEVPDRISDMVILIGAGSAFPNFAVFGWAAALFAVLTAYIRILGSALGTPAFFQGPFAKQHRMFVLTIGAIVQMILGLKVIFLPWVLALIAIGSVITFFRRLSLIVIEIKKGMLKK